MRGNVIPDNENNERPRGGAALQHLWCLCGLVILPRIPLTNRTEDQSIFQRFSFV